MEILRKEAVWHQRHRGAQKTAENTALFGRKKGTVIIMIHSKKGKYSFLALCVVLTAVFMCTAASAALAAPGRANGRNAGNVKGGTDTLLPGDNGGVTDGILDTGDGMDVSDGIITDDSTHETRTDTQTHKVTDSANTDSGVAGTTTDDGGSMNVLGIIVAVIIAVAVIILIIALIPKNGKKN